MRSRPYDGPARPVRQHPDDLPWHRPPEPAEVDPDRKSVV